MAKFGLFENFSDDPRMQRQALESKYNAARSNLLAVAIFTVINIVMLATNAGGYFLFSANIPYMVTYFGMFLCGMFPDEFYADFEGMFFLNKSVFVVTLIISIVFIAFYFICWLLSKNGKTLWLKIALGLFIADSILMLVLGSAGSMIIDIIFHIWVIVILISGIKAKKQLSALPVEDVMIEVEYTDISDDNTPRTEYTDTTEGELNAPVEENGEDTSEN